jgi:AraC-like DNA-binding protein
MNLMAAVRFVWRSGRESDWVGTIEERVTSFYHLVCPTVEGFFCRVGSGALRGLPPGEAALIPPGVVHTYSSRGMTRLLWADFRLLVHGGMDLRSFLSLRVWWDGKPASSLVSALSYALSELDSQSATPAGLQAAQSGLLTAVLAGAQWRDDMAGYMSQIERLVPVLREIRSRLHEKWDRAAIARLAGLAPTQLTRVFQKATGMPPARFVERLRIERIEERLLAGDDTLEALADEFCFSDAFHLSKRFKHWTGLPPRDYRAQFRRHIGR